ncbi:MAG TPA: DUF2721 domain-containing protein [Chloroflexia bacterium]|nr:DUF2721 domain-containing protein [Chloroflexia bacterium]
MDGMSAETVSQTIQLVLAPVVMLSASALLLNGILTRYAAINDRMRNMVRERLELLPQTKTDNEDEYANQRIKYLDYQMPDLMRRHKLAHDAIMSVYLALLIYVVCILLLALGTIYKNEVVSIIAMFCFLIATISIALSVTLTLEEVRTSRRSITYEVEKTFGLK